MSFVAICIHVHISFHSSSNHTLPYIAGAADKEIKPEKWIRSEQIILLLSELGPGCPMVQWVPVTEVLSTGYPESCKNN